MARLIKGLESIYDFLKTKAQGEVVTQQEVLLATDWKPSTLTTYLKKNKLAGFFRKQPNGDLLVLRDGRGISEVDIAGALTQVTPDPTRFNKGEDVVGAEDTYRLVLERGRGAVGHVWEAIASKDGRSVAIKIVNPRPDLLEPTALANVSRRFRREAKNGAKLRSPYIVKHHDNGAHRTRAFLVMELADRSVKDMLDSSGALPEREALKVVRSIANGLAYLHSLGSIHRDVKPANMLVTSRGYILGDLGIVKWGDFSSTFTSAATITKTSVQLGSWYYMAPEQLEAPHSAVMQSDVYALGVSLYEMLTNKTPSPSFFAAGKAKAASQDAALADLVRRMTTFEPDERPRLPEIIEFVNLRIGPEDAS